MAIRRAPLTLFQLREAILALDDQKQFLIFTILWLESPNLWLCTFEYPFGPSKAMFEKRNMKFQKIEKRKFTVLTSKKKIKKISKNCFFPKILIFSTCIWILHVLSFLLSYITQVCSKFSIFQFFSHNISIIDQLDSMTSSGKNSHQRRLFLVCIDS